MECKFSVGQKVVCVGDDKVVPPPGFTVISELVLPIKGQVYTVRAIEICQVRGCSCIRLEEIPDQEATVVGHWDVEVTFMANVTFMARDFRPVVTRKTDISQFQRMLTTTKVEERA